MNIAVKSVSHVGGCGRGAVPAGDLRDAPSRHALVARVRELVGDRRVVDEVLQVRLALGSPSVIVAVLEEEVRRAR